MRPQASGPSPRRRHWEYTTSLLALASAACPALRELHVVAWRLDQPSVPLAHLTRLNVMVLNPAPGGAAPLRRGAGAAPRQEVLDWGSFCWALSMIAATEGHPCLQELRLLDQEGAWLRALPRLPAVSTVQLHTDRISYEGEEARRSGNASGLVVLVCRRLARCERLSHLVLSVEPREQLSAHDLLAAIGAEVGSQLRSLTLTDAQLPPTKKAVAAAMRTLGACYSRLEVLTLRGDSRHMRFEPSAAAALARRLLLAVPVMAPRCPALREVRVDENAVRLQRHPGGGVAAAYYVGSCFE